MSVEMNQNYEKITKNEEGASDPPGPTDSIITGDSSWKDASLDMELSSKTTTHEENESELQTATVTHISEESTRKEEPARRVQFDQISTKKTSSTKRNREMSNGTSSNFPPERKFSFNESNCFKDGRPIDFVLAYTIENGKETKMQEISLRKALYRLRFETALKNRGLQLEYEKAQDSMNGKTVFIKIHAPFEILQQRAELQRMQIPFMISDIGAGESSWWTKMWKIIFPKNPFQLQEKFRLSEIDYFTDTFDMDRRKEFLDYKDELAFFTSAQRAYLVWDIISNITVHLEDESRSFFLLYTISSTWKTRVRGKAPEDENFDPENEEDEEKSEENEEEEEKEETEEEKEEESKKSSSEEESSESEESFDEDIQGHRASFRFLLSMDVYTAGFTLHDGDIKDEPEFKDKPASEWPLRKYLYESWARPWQWKRYQPLRAIRNYYGEKVALYFAFLGFYTEMLIGPGIFGVLVTIYGLISVFFSETTNAICQDTQVGNTILCPDCTTLACHFTRIKNFCRMSQLTAVFDSTAVVVFSVFMAMWAVWFLECWKRYSAELSIAWDVASDDCDEENIRPEYLLRVPHTRLNPVTMRLEPHLKTSVKLKRVAASVATVLFFLVVVIGALAGIMIYKVVGPSWWHKMLHKNKDDLTDYSLIVSLTSSVANGLFMMVMTPIYTKVAWYLTHAEFPRTDREFEESYTYKVFVFQCVNYYGALFYLALIKGRVSLPPHQQSPYDIRCPVSGCLVEVSIQLAVIFTGKQIINNIVEIGLPLFFHCLKKMTKIWCRKKNQSELNGKKLSSWERDFHLNPNERILLFSDYLELLIQYGFVTMFVAAFPLAPLLAFLNNIIEIRLDAYKTLVLTHRCIPLRSRNLGPWFQLLSVITKVAVITNALLIAFTTQFVDRLVYSLVDGQNWVNTQNTSVTHPDASSLFYTLSVFNTSHWNLNTTQFADRSYMNMTEVEKCYYVDYRYPPDDPIEPYERSLTWWHVLAAKFIFIILFEHFVMVFQIIVSYLIADIPKHVKLKMAREKYLIRVNFMRREFGDKAKDDAELSDEPDPDKPFVPDELPEWLVTGTAPHSNTGKKNRRKTVDQANAEYAKTMRRGNVLRPQARKKRPFIIRLFRKLMLCH